MKNILLFLTIVMTPSCATAASKQPIIFKFDPSRTVRVEGVVQGSSVLPAINTILQLAVPDAVEKKPIYMLINSPGGDVMSGGVLVQAMKSAKLRGYEINCGVSYMAASMGFSILMECSNRFALPTSRLLFHSAAVGGAQRVNMFEAAEIYEILAKINKPLLEQILESTGMDEQTMMVAFYQEKFWPMDEFTAAVKKGWITVADDFQGLQFIYPATK
jgi:ATP-dependent protease ClpP protease subunit